MMERGDRERERDVFLAWKTLKSDSAFLFWK